MNPFNKFKTRDYWILLISFVIIWAANILPGQVSILSLVASLVGVTSLVFAAKGNFWAPVLMVVFSILYGIISYDFRYYGEMITYLGMTMPMSVWAAFTWIKNPSEDKNVVEIRRMDSSLWIKTVVATIFVTVFFYFILDYLNTPNMIFSTFSVTTSFLAVCLTMLRSSYYALFYAMNDVILIVLWTLATIKDFQYFSVIIIFVIFLFNDLYGFVSWKKRENKMIKQKKVETEDGR